MTECADGGCGLCQLSRLSADPAAGGTVQSAADGDSGARTASSTCGLMQRGSASALYIALQGIRSRYAGLSLTLRRRPYKSTYHI